MCLQILVDRLDSAAEELIRAAMGGVVSVAQLDACCLSKSSQSRLLGPRSQSGPLNMPQEVGFPSSSAIDTNYSCA